ncbi:hypothetical protein HDU97_006483 [Phlyctochytrium planicorne]|nr:hypothetical protein HDU97_006483 [Phlyctochytrium planicorne]
MPLLLDSVTLDPTTATHIQACVDTCKTRKNAAMMRLRWLVVEVERLLEVVSDEDENVNGSSAAVSSASNALTVRNSRRLRI